jgi:hypothetical protein
MNTTYLHADIMVYIRMIGNSAHHTEQTNTFALANRIKVTVNDINTHFIGKQLIRKM